MNNTPSPLASTPSPLARNATPKSILKGRSSPTSGASVKFESVHTLDFNKIRSPSEVGETKRREDISSHPILRQTQLTQTPLTQTPLSENEQKMLEQLEINRAKARKATERGEEAATQARANTSPEAPTTIQYRREAPVVKEQSLLETFATQSGKVMGGVAESAQVVGQNIQQVAAQNIQSLIGNSFLGNLLPSDKSLQSGSSLPSGPEEVPQRVSRPNGTGNDNIKPHPTQVQGPHPERDSWQQRVTSSREGGRGGETGGGRG